MSVSPTLLIISSLLYTREEHNSMMLPIQITSDNEPGMEIAEALLDSGASGKFIDEDYARDIHVEKKDLHKHQEKPKIFILHYFTEFRQ